MLKFSGLPDLTSCLGRKSFARNSQRRKFEQRHKKVHEVLDLFLAQTSADNLNASTAAGEQRADAQRRVAANEWPNTWEE